MNGKRFREIDGLTGDAAIVATLPSSKALGRPSTQTQYR
jgi:hypothetical protein